MKREYLIRLDDACPTMDSAKWGRMEEILDVYGIKPMVGIIPHNEDSKQEIDIEDAHFWDKVRVWTDKGWTIALHGYNHCYDCEGGMNGLNPMWRRSEFAGLPLDKQRKKIRNGVAIMRECGVIPKYFFAPSHTFDENTIVALREESDIRIISDTIGRYPYKKDDFWFIPQIAGHCVKIPIGGIYTFCFHPNTMNAAAFHNLENFLKNYRSQFVSFDLIDLKQYDRKSIVDRLLSWIFFTIRKMRGLY
jgi:predicted deacetylase